LKITANLGDFLKKHTKNYPRSARKYTQVFTCCRHSGDSCLA